MITETDLRHALAAKAEGAPDRAEVRALVNARSQVATHAHRSARPLLVGLAAAVTVAAIAIGVVLVSGGRSGHGRPPAIGGSTGLDLAYSFSVAPIEGYSVTDRFIYTDHQSVIFGIPGGVTEVTTNGGDSPSTVVDGGTQQVARVDVYGAGRYDPSAARSGTAVGVGTAAGFYANVPVELHDGVADSRTVVPALVWQYAPDSWAVATGFDAAHQTQPVELAYARSITAGATPLLLPAQLHQLPAGLVRTDVWVRTIDAASAQASADIITIGFNRANPAHHGDSDDYAVTMTVVSAAIAAAQGSPSAPDATTPSPQATDPAALGTLVAGGRTYTASTVALPDGTTMYINSPGARLSLSIGWTDRISSTPDLRWADFTPAASMDDTSSWYDGSVAIP